MDYDLFLKQYNVKYEDLNPDERATFHKMLESMQQGQLTIDRLRDYISEMRSSVELELTKFDLGPKQDIYLKARLRNYLLLESFLQTPEKAKKQLELALRGLQK